MTRRIFDLARRSLHESVLSSSSGLLGTLKQFAAKLGHNLNVLIRLIIFYWRTAGHRTPHRYPIGSIHRGSFICPGNLLEHLRCV